MRNDLRHRLSRFARVTALLVALLYALLWGYQSLLPPLSPWHTLAPAADTSPLSTNVNTFEEYQQREVRTFAQLAAQLPPDSIRLQASGTLSNWNRTQEFPTAQPPRAAVLLIHGLSDSPYSLHALAETLQQQNLWVLSLRLPGHGTTPAGLQHVSGDDFSYAVELALQHLQQRTGADTPLYLIGYSTGATLALQHALHHPQQPIAGLTLISPAIAITPAAAVARLTDGLSKLPGLAKLGWYNILPEFDPFKYNSMPMHAVAQVWSLTQSLQYALHASHAPLPPLQIFQSVADATVSADAVINTLLAPLPAGGHHLYLYDINRQLYSDLLFKDDYLALSADVIAQHSPHAITLLTNVDADSPLITLQHNATAAQGNPTRETDLSWPEGYLTLSHVALPFAANDPTYGANLPLTRSNAALAHHTLKGENLRWTLSAGQLLRLRHNPFYNWQEHTIVSQINAVIAARSTSVSP